MDTIYQICEIVIRERDGSVVCGVWCRDPGIYDNTTTVILMLLIVVVDVTSVTASVIESREQIHISNQDGAVS